MCRLRFRQSSDEPCGSFVSSMEAVEPTFVGNCCGIAGLEGLVLGFVFSSHLPYMKSKPSEAAATMILQQVMSPG